MSAISRRQALTAVSLAGAVGLVLGTGSARADQPHMEAALATLRTAEQQLKDATPDKGGHRAKAISLVKQAIGNHSRKFSRIDRTYLTSGHTRLIVNWK